MELMDVAQARVREILSSHYPCCIDAERDRALARVTTSVCRRSVIPRLCCQPSAYSPIEVQHATRNEPQVGRLVCPAPVKPTQDEANTLILEVSKWKYKPYQLNGQPTPFRTAVILNFPNI